SPRGSWGSRPVLGACHGIFGGTGKRTILIPFFAPRIAAPVIAVLFPKARTVFAHEDEPPNPLRALPKIERREHQPAGSPMLRGKGLPIMGERQHHIVPQQVPKRHLGR